MKVIAVLALILAAGCWAVYEFGGFKDFDPAKKAEAFKQSVQPGMTWQDVLDLKEPKRWARIDYSRLDDNRDSRGVSGRFDRPKFEAGLNGAGYPDGFVFEYAFDTAHAYEVWFDGQGEVTAIDDMPTAADLFGMN